MSAAVAPVARDATDPRVRRTRAALLAAFNRLFLEHGYEALSPAGIAAAAGVGRSTFYEHHSGKAALLRDSVTVILQPLADAALGHDAALLPGALGHIWASRALARRLLAGRTGIIMRERLAQLIEDGLRRRRTVAAVPLPLVAASMAAAQLAMIELWLTGRHACGIDRMVLALTTGARPPTSP